MLPLLRQSSLRVAVVGGGPGGLTLATILKRIKIPFTVFELDSSRNARSQGGMLDIHKSTGQLALEKAGLMTEFKKRMRIEATEIFLRDNTGRVLGHMEAESEENPERPEIDRAELRGLLLDALDKEDVKWGKKLVRAEKETDEAGNAFRLHFADGTTADGFNILVGADGTWSKVRRLRSDVPPPYTGMNIVSTSISNIDERFPKLAKFVGNGSCMTYSCIPVQEHWKEESGIDWATQRRGLTEFIQRFHSDWAEEVKELFINCDEGELAVRPVYMFPANHKFEKECSGVTLLGDAAHALSPFAGTGVNNAMYDAYELAEVIEKVAFEGASVDDLFHDYEKRILERAAEDVKECQHNQDMWLTGKPVSEIEAQFKEMMQGGGAAEHNE